MGATHTTTGGMAIEDHPHPPVPTSPQAARISVPDNPSRRTDPSSNLRRGLFAAAPAGQVHVSGYRQGAFIMAIPRPQVNDIKGNVLDVIRFLFRDLNPSPPLLQKCMRKGRMVNAY